jgi:tRNA(Ile)-lysidine synthase
MRETSIFDNGAALSGAEADALFDASFAGARSVLLAVSGGPDSTALLALAAEWAGTGEARPALFVATVDHGLRAQSSVEAASVAALSARFGLPHGRLFAPIDGALPGVEARARDARYAALCRHAADLGADTFATAHTLDDQAETVLMRLAAGSGPGGLAAMRPSALKGHLIHLRPFLDIPKARLLACLRERGLGWAEDDMNGDRRFARARLRAARRTLAREGLTARRLGRLARRLARVEDALEEATAQAAAEHLRVEGARCVIGPAAAALPDEIRLRLLGQAIERAGGGRMRLERLERLAGRVFCEPSGIGTLAGARVAWNPGGTLVVAPAPPRRAHGARTAAEL